MGQSQTCINSVNAGKWILTVGWARLNLVIAQRSNLWYCLMDLYANSVPRFYFEALAAFFSKASTLLSIFWNDQPSHGEG